ncbi:MAG: zeta toxin family protein [Bacteroidia bacterium]
MDRNLYIIAGCNGAGKTTASFTILPEILDCKEFVNADEIAKGLSPFQPETVAFQAGRIMLGRIRELLNERQTFAFETTLATKSYKNLVLEAQDLGYRVSLLFFWLDSPELAVDRVRRRVSKGGHSIPVEVVHRRYRAGIVNLINIFLPIVDHWAIMNNTSAFSEIIAERLENGDVMIHDRLIFAEIEMYGELRGI